MKPQATIGNPGGLIVCFATLALLAASTVAQAVPQIEADTELHTDQRTGQVDILRHIPSDTKWPIGPSPLFLLDGEKELATHLETRSTADGIILTLSITNRGKEPRRVTPTFPNLTFTDADEEDHRLLRYCFPARAALVGRENRSDRAFYSGIGPLQFMAVDHPRLGSVHAVICDPTNSRKLFGLDKTDGSLRLFAEHESRILAPDADWVLPPVLLATTDGTWHSGLEAYRRWLNSWFRPAAPRRADFRKVWNFRVFYPHHAPPMNSRIFDPDQQRWSISKAVDRDVRIFGGIDFMHLYGWASTPEHGRVGDYAPWNHVGGLPGFRKQLQALQARDIPAGLYLEGYLVSPQSRIAKKHGPEWAMTDSTGRRIDRWGGGYFTMCPHVPGWQDYLAETCRRLSRETGADGLYIDQFGFLTQYRCSNPAHTDFHAMGAHMLAGEYEVLRKIREAVGDEFVIYTEEVPTDVMTRLTDGAYTAAVKMSLARGISRPIHLTRFALPDFKTIELISERGIGDNLHAVRATFFNGEALYLSGDASLFSPPCLKLIGKTHALLKEYADAFTSMNPRPLVETLDPAVHANRFPASRRVVWTLLHTGTSTFEGPVLRVPHRKGCRYLDAWNKRILHPEITADGHAMLSLQIEAGETGCIVQSW